jgi:hypothetical protein
MNRVAEIRGEIPGKVRPEMGMTYGIEAIPGLILMDYPGLQFETREGTKAFFTRAFIRIKHLTAPQVG